jgi:hypothetical protein
MKLTTIDNAPYVNLNSLIHIVNTGDTTQSPDGSSYKAPLSDLSPLFGGGNTYWSASTGTNAIVIKNSNSVASGINSSAEGLNTTAGGYTSKASGYNSKALGITSFVHSSNSTVDVSANRSAIIGGQSITATNADTVYVPNLNINTAPANDNALTQVLVRATDGTVKYKTLGGLASFNWVTVTTIGGSTYNAVSNTGYVSNNGHPANQTQYLLPTTAAIGDIVKVMVIDGRASLTVAASQQIVYGTGDNDTGGYFTAPLDFNFGKYESAEVTYIGSNKWILSNFQTTQDLSSNPLTDRIY